MNISKSPYYNYLNVELLCLPRQEQNVIPLEKRLIFNKVVVGGK